MRRVIALANQKGGCAKTTSTVNLAACLGELGQRVLVVDLDPQAHASAHLGATDSDDDGRALFDLFAAPGDLQKIVVADVAPGVDLIPSGLILTRIDLELMGKRAWEKRLMRCLKETPGIWDWILLDCPPNLGFLTINALVAATGALVPVQSTALSIAGLTDLVNTVAEIREEDNPGLTLVGILPCQAHPRRLLHRQALTALQEQYPGKVAPVVIREGVAIAEAAGHQQSVITYAPKSNGAEDYRAAATWLREVVG